MAMSGRVKRFLRFFIGLVIGFVIGLVVSGQISCLPAITNWIRP